MSKAMSKQIACHVSVGRASGMGVARFVYDELDPLAVTFVFADGTTWRFARDLLIDGMRTGAAEGVFSIVLIELQVEIIRRRDDGREVCVGFPVPRMRELLGESYRIVPLGHESDGIDAFLQSLGVGS